MKRFLATILSFVLLTGCAQNDAENTIVQRDNGEPFYGSFEDVNATRTYVNEAMTMLWHADDRISLFRSTLNEEFKFTGETGDSAGDFEEIPSEIFVTGAEISTNYGVYPYNSTTTISEDETITLTMPSVQAYAQNSFGCGANTAVAATENSSSRFLPFRNVGGFLVVKIYSPSGVVKSVELKGNNGEVLAGEATVQAKYGYLPLLTMGDGTDSITLDCGGGVEVGTTEDSATHFWFVVPPTTFESGFTVSVTDTAGAVTTKSTTKRNEISRNEVTVMSAFEIAETENKPTPANNEIWYTAPAKLEPYDNSVFGATYLSNIWDSETGRGVITFDGDVTTIGDFAFAFCDSLTSVTIPDSVTTIGDYAFITCTGLTSITIPDSVTEIGDNVFEGCTSLTSVYCKATTPPSGGYYMFYEIASNSKIYVPTDSVVAYKEANGWSDYADYIVGYNFENGEVDDEEEDPSHPVNPANNEIWYTAIIKVEPYYTDEFGATYISNVWDSETGKGVITFEGDVTKIGYYAFYNCISLTSVTIPDSVTTIGDYAFGGCYSLTSVTIPDSVTTIGDYAFSNCESLTSITIPDGVTTIGDYTFRRCHSLTSITIPDGVTSIGEGAFFGCSSLTSVTIPDSVTTIGYYAFYECESLTSITIPDGVTSIGDGAFYWCDSLTSVTIPDSVTTIGVNAFYCCTSLTSVTIPDSVTTIGALAFEGCTSLTSITIPDSVTTIGDSAFYYCDSLTSVTIGDRVTTIGSSAFSSCNSLTSVTIGDRVTTIGSSAFSSCNSLTSVTIGDSVTTIGDYAFYSCTSLKEFKGKFAADNGRCLIMDNTIIAYAEASGTTYTIPDSVTTIGVAVFQSCGSLTSVTIPDSVTTIGDYAFGGCYCLTSVTIGNSVTTIGEGAFGWCTSLTSVTIPDSVTTIGVGAFQDCTSLTSVTIPDSVTTIEDFAFYKCTSLTSVTIGDSVTEIGNSAFDCCFSLTSVTIGNSVTTIGDSAFYNCDILTSVTIPDSVTTIGVEAFCDCDSLTSVTIGDSVTTIGDYAFYSCNSLKTVYCKPTTPPTGGNYVFHKNAAGRRIFVPASNDDSIIKAYKAKQFWREYADAIVGYNF